VRYKTAYQRPLIRWLSIGFEIDFHRELPFCSRNGYQCSKHDLFKPTGTHANLCQKLRVVCLYYKPKFEVQNRKAPYSKSPYTHSQRPVSRSNLNLILTVAPQKWFYIMNLTLKCCSQTKSTSERLFWKHPIAFSSHCIINVSMKNKPRGNRLDCPVSTSVLSETFSDLRAH
jgi:hypothetical protein